MHPLISSLLGTWVGQGQGQFPTLDAFDYQEQLTMKQDAGRVVYEQMAQKRIKGQDWEPSHWEFGFLHSQPDSSQIQINNCQNGGRVEWMVGQIIQQPQGFNLQWESVGFGNDPRMRSSRRTWCFRQDKLVCTHWMATDHVTQSELHLQIELHRQ